MHSNHHFPCPDRVQRPGIRSESGAASDRTRSRVVVSTAREAFPPSLISLCFALWFGLSASGQANRGQLHLRIIDPAGLGHSAIVHVVSPGNQYAKTLSTKTDGSLDLQQLPFGLYHIDANSPGFAVVSAQFEIRSSVPIRSTLQLTLAPVSESVTVKGNDTLLPVDQPGSTSLIGTQEVRDRTTSIPGRSFQDLVITQPGWLYEGNAVLHPRESEYQTQIVLNGVPLTDNRSPSFGPEVEADDVQSINIYTAGIPAEYGRKMGGIIEVDTLQDAQPGLHGQAVASGGSFDSAGGFAQAQYTRRRDAFGALASASRTDRYLNPVVPQNDFNTGSVADFSVHYERAQSTNNKFSLDLSREFSNFDSPNEYVQQATGQQQTGSNAETRAIASYSHLFSDRTAADAHAMVRSNTDGFNSNAASTPIEIFQHNRFDEAYFKFSATSLRHSQEWKAGIEADNTFLNENLRYVVTDPTQFDPGTPADFAFAASRPDLEQSAFVQDLIHGHDWTIAAGLRWDHYQLLLNRQAFSPRLAASHYFRGQGLIAHISYDRVFQTPSFENILLSSSSSVEAIDPQNFLRLPVQPSVGNYYEAGLSKQLGKQLRIDANYFRRQLQNFADDNQLENTTISFPIAFRKAVIYGLESKIEVPAWHRFSGFASYSYALGNVWFPVTGGLFLGAEAAAAASQLSGHFPSSQDQRNTARGRLRYAPASRMWVAAGVQYDSGLPFEFDGDPSTVLAEYGPQILARLNFARGRIDPSFQVSASAGLTLHKSENKTTTLQVDGENLSNTLDALDFGGLFSGNAIGPPRSVSLRLTTLF